MAKQTKTILGVDAVPAQLLSELKTRRVGLLCNHASVGADFVHSRFLLGQRGVNLTCLFSPQHGFAAEQQDNMIESDHGIDVPTGLPLFSLYGEHRKPTAEMLDQLDLLLVDLMDVGTRVYTFIHTMAYCLEAAAAFGKKVVVLDRPNPIGGALVEGNLLKNELRSFVGLYPIPMRHGMTMGELARFFNETFSLGAELDVIPMSGWQRSMYFDDTGLNWVFPSPNMPGSATALVYPGQVIWEGTNVSEGRGTTLPFELVGAPYWNIDDIVARLDGRSRAGCLLRPSTFQPTSGKWADQVCHGFQIHVLDKHTYRPYRTSLALLQAVFDLYPDDFNYKEPPYEYEYEKLPIDLILGDRSVRKQLEERVPIAEIENQWQQDLEDFLEVRKSFLLYA